MSKVEKVSTAKVRRSGLVALAYLQLTLMLVLSARSSAQDEASGAGVARSSSIAGEPLEGVEDGAPSGAEERTAAPTCKGADSDRDGVCDAVELATGTRLLRADTDEDGVPDGVEDVDHDGVVDPGESDPRVPGLFPGSYPHMPEPMVFDLVRGLGAKKDEVEVNVLAVLDWRRQRRHLLWAPEVEWAVADGMALELELPVHGRQLDSVKSAFQVTLPEPRRNFIHGVQFVAEYLLDARSTEATALYLFGGRLGRASILTMAGVRATTPMRESLHYQALLNPSLYVDLVEAVTLGVEINAAVALTGHSKVAFVPQLHWQVTRSLRIQAGGGMRLVGSRIEPLIATRIVLE